MTHGEWLYLDMTLAVFAIFMAVLAYGCAAEAAASRRIRPAVAPIAPVLDPGQAARPI